MASNQQPNPFPIRTLVNWSLTNDIKVISDGALGLPWEEIAFKIYPWGTIEAWKVELRWFYLTHPPSYDNPDWSWLPVEDFMCHYVKKRGLSWSQLPVYLANPHDREACTERYEAHHKEFTKIF